MNNIEEVLSYYMAKRNEILDFVNSSKKNTVEEIIESGSEMAILEYKITALEIAKGN